MLPLGKITDFTRLITPPVIGALVVGYFAYHSLKGDHGLSAYLLLTAEVIKAESVRSSNVGPNYWARKTSIWTLSTSGRGPS